MLKDNKIKRFYPIKQLDKAKEVAKENGFEVFFTHHNDARSDQVFIGTKEEWDNL